MLARKKSRHRFTIAYLPWLSQFEFWKNPKRLTLQTAEEEEGHHYRDSARRRSDKL